MFRTNPLSTWFFDKNGQEIGGKIKLIGMILAQTRALNRFALRLISQGNCNMATRAFLLGLSLCSFSLPCLLGFAIGQEPPKSSPRPDIAWLNEEIFKTLEPQLRERQKNSSVELMQNLADKPKGALSPEQRKIIKDESELLETAESIAREMRFGIVSETDQSPLAIEYRNALKAFQESSADLGASRNRQILSYKLTPEQSRALEKEWFDAIANAAKNKKAWLQKAAELYAANPEAYENLGRTVQEAFLFDMQHDRFDGWVDPLMAIVSVGGPLVTEELLLSGVAACIANNRYAEVYSLFDLLSERGLMDENKERFAATLPAQQAKWNQELDRRKADSERDDNPIVELRTSKGIMMIELFEDDAPEAVNSFIYLVERKFYDLKPFFRVEKGLVAQTGCEKGDGSGSAGYTFKGESKSPNKRFHFRGSLAVALSGDSQGNVIPDSGSSQFYIAKTDLPHLDDDYTVFGRVVEGIDTLGLLRQLNLANKEEREAKKRPDLIISAKVIRKRNHDYKPTPVSGKVFGLTNSS